MTTNLPLPAAVLWDLDGTLIDSERYWHLGELDLAARYQATWTTEDSAGMVGLSLPVATQILKDKFNINDMQTSEIADHLTEIVVSNLRIAMPWRPGARELLLELRECGIKTALVTMSLRRMALEVAESIGFDAFDVVVAGDDVSQGKPHPEAYLRAAELLQVDASHCIAIEDSHNGLLSAEAAGTVALGIPHFMKLEPSDSRTIWPTLEGIGVSELSNLYRQKIENRA